MRALRFLYFKRSFVIVRKALADPDAQVREAALVAIGGLHFPHAFNPLARIYRESNDPRVRGAALQSIGKIQTVEAGEFLVMVLRQETGDAARGRVRRARADGQRRRDADPAPAPRDRDQPAGPRHARRAAAPALMGARRKRPIVGISGLFLFICMFVPAVRGCGHEPIVPIAIPPVIPPYLLGLGFGLAGMLAGSRSNLKGAAIYLRVVMLLFLVECMIAVVEEPQFGLVVVIAPILMLVILGLRETTDRRLGGAATVCGLASAIWFGLFCGGEDALIGVWVSLFSSIALAISGIAWLADPGEDPPDNEADLPRATVISSGE